ncbi:MAG: PAS domain S-box protein [Geminicoccaceae bacterium]
MSAVDRTAVDRHEELLELVAILTSTQERILELTGGQVDAVVQPSGALHLLPQTQKHFRQREAVQRAFGAERAAILDALPAQIALLDRSGRILVVNRQWQASGESNGLPRGYSFVGRSYVDICTNAHGASAEGAPAIAEGVRAVLRGALPFYTQEYVCPTPNGQRWFQLLVAPLADPTKRGAVVMHIDITREMAVRNELRDTITRLNAIFDNVVDGIVTINEQGAIESLNQSAGRMFGYVPDTLLGRDVAVLMPTFAAVLSDCYHHQRVHAVAGHVAGFECEVDGLRADGSSVPLALGLSEMRLGERLLYIGIVRDITERKRIERLQSEFISTASHELRTPLTSILASLKLIAHGTEALPAVSSRLIQLAYRNSERLKRLVDDILDVERLGSGQVKLEFAPITLHELVAQCLETRAADAASLQVGLSLEAAAATDHPLVHADGERIHQVLGNLVGNAVKFSPPGAIVRLRIQ